MWWNVEEGGKGGLKRKDGMEMQVRENCEAGNMSWFRDVPGYVRSQLTLCLIDKHFGRARL